MPRTVIAGVAAVIAAATAGLVVALWWAGTAGLSGPQLVTARFDALRTGLSIGVGGGGIFALYLAWRRQYATEIGLVQKERDQADVARTYELQRETAEHNREDAAARRVTELYLKAVEQLGSDKAVVRQGGLYALERVAQDNEAQRQTVINVICAYLRGPYKPPPGTASGRRSGIPGSLRGTPDKRVAAAGTAARRTRLKLSAPVLATEDAYREREVRLTAQGILIAHLRHDPGKDGEAPGSGYWPGRYNLNLAGATLIDLNLRDCRIDFAIFDGATFIGDARFTDVIFTGGAGFDGAIFLDNAWFGGTTFTSDAGFNRVTFANEVWFRGVTFTNDAVFDGSTFTGDVRFTDVTVPGNVRFNGVNFTRSVLFSGIVFTNGAQFAGANFNGDTRFVDVIFAKSTWFNGSVFAGNVLFGNAFFSSIATAAGSRALVDQSASGVRTRREQLWPAGWTVDMSAVSMGEDQQARWVQLVPVPVVLVAHPPQSGGCAEG